MSFQGLSENVGGDGWVTKLRGKSIPGGNAFKMFLMFFYYRIKTCFNVFFILTSIFYNCLSPIDIAMVWPSGSDADLWLHVISYSASRDYTTGDYPV